MKHSVALFFGLLCCGQVLAASTLTEAQLGSILFSDPSFSGNRSMSCATCHDPAQGFTDHRNNAGLGMVSLGADQHSLGNRNAPTVTYAATAPAFHFDSHLNEYVGGLFLDGRATTLADQAMGPPLNNLEMALPSPAHVVARLQENPVYKEAFLRLYGPGVFDLPATAGATPPAFIAFGKAVQAFEQTREVSTYDSKYDRYLKGEYELTVLEDLGRTLFFSNNNVNCGTCHKLNAEDSTSEPFTNHQYRNIGVPANAALIALGQLPKDYIDHGLLQNPAVTDKKYDGMFKNPTLRNIAVTGPYMHNGVFRDLRTVIEFYDHYNNPERKLNPETGKPWRDPEVADTVSKKDLKAQPLTDRKIDALVAFLKALTDQRYEPLLEGSQH